MSEASLYIAGLEAFGQVLARWLTMSGRGPAAIDVGLCSSLNEVPDSAAAVVVALEDPVGDSFGDSLLQVVQCRTQVAWSTRPIVVASWLDQNRFEQSAPLAKEALETCGYVQLPLSFDALEKAVRESKDKLNGIEDLPNRSALAVFEHWSRHFRHRQGSLAAAVRLLIGSFEKRQIKLSQLTNCLDLIGKKRKAPGSERDLKIERNFIQAARDLAGMMQREPAPLQHEDRQPKRNLVLFDDEAVSAGWQVFFDNCVAGWSVKLCSSVKTWKDILDKHCRGLGTEQESGGGAAFDLFLIDRDLGIESGMDGLEALRQLRVVDPFTPAILFTADESSDAYDQAIEAGAVDVFVKQLADRRDRSPASYFARFAEMLNFWGERTDSRRQLMRSWQMLPSAAGAVDGNDQEPLAMCRMALALATWLAEGYFRGTAVNDPPEADDGQHGRWTLRIEDLLAVALNLALKAAVASYTSTQIIVIRIRNPNATFQIDQGIPRTPLPEGVTASQAKRWARNQVRLAILRYSMNSREDREAYKAFKHWLDAHGHADTEKRHPTSTSSLLDWVERVITGTADKLAWTAQRDLTPHGVSVPVPVPVQAEAVSSKSRGVLPGWEALQQSGIQDKLDLTVSVRAKTDDLRRCWYEALDKLFSKSEFSKAERPVVGFYLVDQDDSAEDIRGAIADIRRGEGQPRDLRVLALVPGTGIRAKRAARRAGAHAVFRVDAPVDGAADYARRFCDLVSGLARQSQRLRGPYRLIDCLVEAVRRLDDSLEAACDYNESLNSFIRDLSISESGRECSHLSAWCAALALNLETVAAVADEVEWTALARRLGIPADEAGCERMIAFVSARAVEALAKVAWISLSGSQYLNTADRTNVPISQATFDDLFSACRETRGKCRELVEFMDGWGRRRLGHPTPDGRQTDDRLRDILDHLLRSSRGLLKIMEEYVDSL